VHVFLISDLFFYLIKEIIGCVAVIYIVTHYHLPIFKENDDNEQERAIMLMTRTHRCWHL